MDHPSCSIKFRYKAHTIFGENIRIVGNIDALGNWNPDCGLSLKTNESKYPFWETQYPISVPMHSEIQYKYIFTFEFSHRWESTEENRILYTQGGSLTIHDEEHSMISKHEISSLVEIPEAILNLSEKECFEMKEHLKLQGNESVILASLNLPIQVEKEDEGFKFSKASGVWLPVLYDIAVQEGIKFLWVGFPGIIPENEEEKKEITETLREEYNCIPVFIPKNIFEKHTEFCNGVLYPVFNNIIETGTNLPEYEEDQWEAYMNVNSQFADAILENFDDDMIWIHNYELILTPSLVSRRGRSVFNIGFYLHCPFPSSEIFRVLPHREVILQAMLCCDLIGFHNFGYSRNFIVSCKRLLGLNHEFSKGGYLSLSYDGRNILIRIGHLGIEPRHLNAYLETSDFEEKHREIEREYEGKKLILGIDSANKLSGISLKLNSFRAVMRELKDEIEYVKFVELLSEPKKTDKFEQERFLDEITSLEKEINEEFGIELVEFKYGFLDRETKYAYMREALGIVNSSVREGLYLTPFEFLYVNQKRESGIIVSEFSGINETFQTIRLVNPFDTAQLQTELKHLLLSTYEVKNKESDIAYLLKKTTFKWAKSFLQDLKRAQKDTNNFQYATHGFGNKVKIIALNKHFEYLEPSVLVRPYEESTNQRVIFLDFRGTITPLNLFEESDPTEPLSNKLLNSLTELSNDEKNTVVLITGKSKEYLHEIFSSVPNLVLAAEYGAFIRWNIESAWFEMAQGSKAWKDIAKEIIESYVTKTEGAYMEIKECAVVFEYSNSDPDLGTWQAKELISELELLLKKYLNTCEISNGLAYVEVKPRGINKGTTVYELLQKVKEIKGPVDFVMAIGDDVSDEEMFKVINFMKKEKSIVFCSNKVFTVCCTVGRKPSGAEFYLNDFTEVIERLDLLRGISSKANNKFVSGFSASAVGFNQFMNLEISKEVDEDEIFSPLKPKKSDRNMKKQI